MVIIDCQEKGSRITHRDVRRDGGCGDAGGGRQRRDGDCLVHEQHLGRDGVEIGRPSQVMHTQGVLRGRRRGGGCGGWQGGRRRAWWRRGRRRRRRRATGWL